MQQAWYNLLFAHWEVSVESLRALVPPQLPLDLFEGRAYVAVVPFGMADIRMRGLPKIPGTHRFLELNVRTYVRLNDRAGVYFFSLDAASLLAVRTARFWFGLPYFDARMQMRTASSAGEWTDYRSVRTHRGATAAELECRYRLVGEQFLARPDTLEHWLTERYCLYAIRRGRLLRGEIHHRPWPLFRAEATFAKNTMLPAGLETNGPPLLHYAPHLDVVAWAPTPC